MTDLPTTPQAADICLLLRAHGEQLWLLYEVVPVLRQLERGEEVPEEQLGAAFAYLEALWIQARGRAAQTDGSLAQLNGSCRCSLRESALRYHAAVRALRMLLARRVAVLLAIPGEASAQERAAS